VNLLRRANVLLSGAKLALCLPRRRKSGHERGHAQGGKSRRSSRDNGHPDNVADKAPPALKPVRDASLMRRQNAVAGECGLRKIAGATRRRVARSSPPCQYSSTDTGPRAFFAS
jgi:hypothetical protein